MKLEEKQHVVPIKSIFNGKVMTARNKKLDKAQETKEIERKNSSLR